MGLSHLGHRGDRDQHRYRGKAESLCVAKVRKLTWIASASGQYTIPFQSCDRFEYSNIDRHAEQGPTSGLSIYLRNGTVSRSTSFLVGRKLTLCLCSVFQLLLAIDATIFRNTIQIIGLSIFNGLFLVYAVIQVSFYPFQVATALIPRQCRWTKSRKSWAQRKMAPKSRGRQRTRSYMFP